jgi:uncharacterized protein
MDNIVCNLVITEKCNLACKYCYMNNNNTFMSYNIIDKLYENIDYLINCYNGKTFNIDFFGGEPLLNWDIIQYTVNKFKNKKNLKYFTIISNLLLIDQNKINYITDNNIGCSWSFDGLYNSDIRVSKINNSSTLNEYITKLHLIKKLTDTCKCTITSEHILNSGFSLSENFKYMIEDLGIFPDYTLSKDFWPDNAIVKLESQLKELADLYIQYVNNGKIIKFGFFNLILSDIVLAKKTKKRNFSCFAGTNGFCIMSNGDIYPCARYGTNKIDILGNITDIATFKKFEFIDKLNPLNFEKCKKCKMYDWCNTGCQYMQEINNFKPLDSYCKLYKLIFNYAMYIYENLKNNKQWIMNLHYEYR